MNSRVRSPRPRRERGEAKPLLGRAGKTVTHLEYESYAPLAIKTIHSILLEARDLPAVVPTTTHCFDHSQDRKSVV